MTRQLRLMFLTEVQHECKLALLAIRDLDRAIESEDVTWVWQCVWAVLVAAANISKLLWPPKEAFQARGEELRNLLAVPAESPLHSRDFRNHFEHFDERLEEWAARTGGEGGAFDLNVMPLEMLPRNTDPHRMLRHFDPTARLVIFRGEPYELRPIAESISALWQNCEKQVRWTLAR